MRRSHFVGRRKSIYRILTIVWLKSDCNPGRLRPSRASTFFREDGGAVGAIATHFDDVLGCGEQDVEAILTTFPAETRLLFGILPQGDERAGFALRVCWHGVARGIYVGIPQYLTGASGCAPAAIQPGAVNLRQCELREFC